MGYDFILLRLRRPVAPCPARIPPEFGKESVIAIDDPAPLHDAIRASPLFEPGTVDFDGGRVLWRTPDGGTLTIDTITDGIHIAPRAHWDHVAELFEVSVVVWPDLALFDLQRARVHDPPSFREFIEQCHREAEERQARQDEASS